LLIIIFVILWLYRDNIYITLFHTSDTDYKLEKIESLFSSCFFVFILFMTVVGIIVLLIKAVSKLNNSEFCKTYLLNIYLIPFTSSNTFEYKFLWNKLHVIQFIRLVSRRLSDEEFCALFLFFALPLLIEICFSYPFYILMTYLKNLYYLKPLEIYQLKDMHQNSQGIDSNNCA